MHSWMTYNSAHFNGTDFDQRTGRNAIFKLRDWSDDVDDELGNFDYLLCANLNLSDEEVRQDLFRWCQWISNELGEGLTGFRFDAAKHMSRSFMTSLIERFDPKLMLIGEYATPKAYVLARYIEDMQHRLCLFDFPLHANLVRLSRARRPDLRLMFEGSLVKLKPENTVPFVTNHDAVSVPAYSLFADTA